MNMTPVPVAIRQYLYCTVMSSHTGVLVSTPIIYKFYLHEFKKEGLSSPGRRVNGFDKELCVHKTQKVKHLGGRNPYLFKSLAIVNKKSTRFSTHNASRLNVGLLN